MKLKVDFAANENFMHSQIRIRTFLSSRLHCAHRRLIDFPGRQSQAYRDLCPAEHKARGGAHVRLQVPHRGRQDPVPVRFQKVPEIPQLISSASFEKNSEFAEPRKST